MTAPRNIQEKVKLNKKMFGLVFFEIWNGKCRQWIKKLFERSIKIVSRNIKQLTEF